MSYKQLQYWIVYCFTILWISAMFQSCNGIDYNTQNSFKKQSKKIIKQAVGSIQHLDATQDFISFETRPNQNIKLYWQDENKNILGSLQNLQQYLAIQGDSLLYACNGGMYMQNQHPLGLYIQNGKVIQKINLKSGTGNFYLIPKGIFYITNDGKMDIANFTTTNPISEKIANLKYATQSGPMLVINNKINPLFDANSINLNIRNGVGILPNGQALFAMSTYPINFFDFANYFKTKGCKQALYLDGFVSRTYCPGQNYKQLDGTFGVMIGVTNQ
jgi:uncharacterized protein YigE (DUF2233 family)